MDCVTWATRRVWRPDTRSSPTATPVHIRRHTARRRRRSRATPTGLTGSFDITLEWKPDPALARSGAAGEVATSDDRPSIFTGPAGAAGSTAAAGACGDRGADHRPPRAAHTRLNASRLPSGARGDFALSRRLQLLAEPGREADENPSEFEPLAARATHGATSYGVMSSFYALCDYPKNSAASYALCALHRSSMFAVVASPPAA